LLTSGNFPDGHSSPGRQSEPLMPTCSHLPAVRSVLILGSCSGDIPELVSDPKHPSLRVFNISHPVDIFAM
jgi:hypothetical protein